MRARSSVFLIGAIYRKIFSRQRPISSAKRDKAFEGFSTNMAVLPDLQSVRRVPHLGWPTPVRSPWLSRGNKSVLRHDCLQLPHIGRAAGIHDGRRFLEE